MSRLVVISNRLADPRKSAAGGLAVALGDALARTGGLWFGWSGTVTADGTPGAPENRARVVSYGADGQEGGQGVNADITSDQR